MGIQLLKNKKLGIVFPRKILYLCICLAGALLALSANWYIQQHKDVYSFSSVPYGEYVSSEEREIPVGIVIPALSLSLRVDPASVSNNSWPVSEEFVNYLYQSAVPGEGSNIVLYGHNKPTIFGSIFRLTKGDTILLTVQSGKEYQYSVTNKQIVLPTAVEYIQPTASEILTLYTCTGLFDSKRLIIQAKPI